MTKRIKYLKSEIKRVNEELIRLSGFTLSSDVTIQSLRKYKKDLFKRIKFLSKEATE
jgi:hypothetical protein